MVPSRGACETPTMRLLVVEDDQLIAASLVRALEANGYQATACDSVTRAIEQIDAVPPDLVLLDLGLPDDDGSVVLDGDGVNVAVGVRDVGGIDRAVESDAGETASGETADLREGSADDRAAVAL